MPSNINTTISNITDYYDINKQLLPPGNYYFKIKKYRNNVFKGEISMGSKGSYGDFNIKAIDLVKMMAIAQARLGRRIGNEGIQEEGFPQYSSPFNSPKNKNNNQGMASNASNASKENTVIRTQEVILDINNKDNKTNNKESKHDESKRKETKKNTENNVNECSICLDRITKKDEKVLSCSHAFHWKCIKKWYYNHKTCPICRKVGDRYDKMRCYTYSVERKSFVLKS